MKLGIRAVFAATVAGVCSASWPVSMAPSAAPMTPKQSALKGMPVVRAAQDPVVDKLIVRLRSTNTQGQAQAMSASRVSAFSAKSGVGMKSLRSLAGGSHLLQLERPMPLSQARQVAAQLSNDADVQYAEPNIRFKRMATPNEPRFAQWQWNLFSPSSNYTGALGGTSLTTTALGGANLPLAWDVSTGSNAVVVAVIDSGITNHADLNGAPAGATYVPAGRFLPGYDFVSSINGFGLPANFVANDGDGRDPDPSDPGDWITAAEKVTYKDSCDDGVTGSSDSSWHGTHMAGIVAATANNSMGIAGIGWGVRVLPVRALGKCGGDLADISEAMRWAAGLTVNGVPANTTPAQVINLSLGGGDTCSPEMQSTVDAVIAAGSVIVAATGNAGDLQLIAPANCKGVVAVTAHAINGENADYANVGAGTTLSAPGGGPPTLLGASGVANNPSFDGYYVHSSVLFGRTTPTSSSALGDTGPAYAGFTGTSVATPHVAGVAALLKSVAPNADPGFIKSWLGAADKLRPHPTGGFCNSLAQECGHGLLDAQKALVAAVDLAPSVSISVPTRLAAPGASVVISGTVAAFPAKTIQSAVWSTTAGSLSATTGSMVTLTAPATGVVEIALTVTDSAGKVARDAVQIRVNSAPTAASIPNQAGTVGQSVNFTVTGSDPDSDPLTFIATDDSTVPTSALSASGQFSWNTTGYAANSYQLKYFVTDGLAQSAIQTVSITLTAPVAAPPPAGGGGGGGGGSAAVPPSGGGGGGGALPWLQLLLLGALLVAPRIRQRVG